MQQEQHPPRTDPAPREPASASPGTPAPKGRRAAARRIDCGGDSSHDVELEPPAPGRHDKDLPRASE